LASAYPLRQHQKRQNNRLQFLVNLEIRPGRLRLGRCRCNRIKAHIKLQKSRLQFTVNLHIGRLRYPWLGTNQTSKKSLTIYGKPSHWQMEVPAVAIAFKTTHINFQTSRSQFMVNLRLDRCRCLWLSHQDNTHKLSNKSVTIYDIPLPWPIEVPVAIASRQYTIRWRNMNSLSLWPPFSCLRFSPTV
jgi:hypothetical protein